MVDTKVPAKVEKKSEAVAPIMGLHPFETLRQEVERLFDDFYRGSWRTPFTQGLFGSQSASNLILGAIPAADVVEKDNTYEITAELPGLSPSDIDVQITNHTVTIKGEKKEEREEKRQDHYLSERRYGTFRRTFELPDGVDADKIDADFSNGVLKIILPKTAEVQKKQRKIAITTK